MPKYKVKIRQARPVIVEADNEKEAYDLAFDASEWDDDYEMIEENEECSDC